MVYLFTQEAFCLIIYRLEPTYQQSIYCCNTEHVLLGISKNINKHFQNLPFDCSHLSQPEFLTVVIQ